MKILHTTLSISILLAAALPSPVADPVEEIKSFSIFENVDLSALAEGDILGQRGALMNFPRGISVQTCYVVKAPPEVTVRKIVNWNATVHPELKIFTHHTVAATPFEDDFKPLDFSRDASSIRWFLEKTDAVTADKSDFQMSRAEAAEMQRALRAKPPAGQTRTDVAATAWKNLLLARATKFSREGLKGVAPYEMNGNSVNPATEIQSLLKEDSRISARFAELLAGTPLGGTTNAPPPTVSVAGYWELFEITSHGAINLGFSYTRGSDGRFQIVGCEPFASNGYLASLAFYEFWPIEAGGRPATLVWRQDMVSAPSLAMTRGIERIASGGIMVQEIKRSIRLFREDLDKELEKKTAAKSP